MTTAPERQPTPWIAALASAVVPGAGQVYAGRRTGWLLVGLDIVLLELLFVSGREFTTSALKAFASTGGLAWITVASILVLGFRAWAAWDAYRLAGGGAPTVMWGVAAVVVVLLVPHVVVGYYTSVQYSVVTQVFASEDDQAPPPEASGGTDAIAASSTTLPPDEDKIWDGLERLNVLLLGADTGEGRTGIRTDTMMVVSIDPATSDIAVVSIPRNMSGISLPDGVGIWDCNCFPKLLNDLFGDAYDYPDAFPGPGEPGPNAMKAALGGLLDLDIQYYALVNLEGFIDLVDALGGVDIYVPYEIVDETYPHEDGVTIENVVIEAGEQHLDGHYALAYSRIRRHADDFARMNRQRCVLGALAAQSSPFELLASYGDLAKVLTENLETDIPRERLPDFIDLLPNIALDRIGILDIDRDYIASTAEGRAFYDEARIKSEAAALLADPSAFASSDGGLNLENTCDG